MDTCKERNGKAVSEKGESTWHVGKLFVQFFLIPVLRGEVCPGLASSAESLIRSVVFGSYGFAVNGMVGITGFESSDFV